MAVDFFAGCIGGCAGVLVGHPFDTVKVRLQTQNFSKPQYKGTFDCFISIAKKESVFGLYKGMSSPLYGLAAINAIVFGVQRNVQRRMENPQSLTSHFIAGSVAGLAQSVICSPMELAKTRMQIQGQGASRKKYRQVSLYKGPVDCLCKIYKTEGLRGLSRGFGLTVVRETPSFGVYFWSFEYMCRMVNQEEALHEVHPAVLFGAGGMAGICAWIVTYPVDLIKSRVQADMTGKYAGFWDCVQKSYSESGLRGFSYGLAPTLLRAFPTNAATFAGVAMTLRLLKADMDDDAFYDLSSTYSQIAHSPPHARMHLEVANFPSHP
ncbi:hypothetical protein CAPTEDRAFT_97572 [Capitella teleta]|uniref:Mitochondrial basic amino acids transporter n=1 Tax=Capitella teleta TaxID=283909 RepID=R7UEY9_CAPTE|nr:hypothetical protein CAPTEDRAFT_97572 [Capitella teleta]|eukprot:ELU04534.1 hypothetical protein CAPTEDRAFT_97572 [Capitella teleta]